MASVVRNFIEYAGIAELFPVEAVTFKQVNLEESIILPNQKPNIGQIVKVVADVSIKSTRVIKTPVATSLEGQRLTGWKLIIEGQMNEKIEYIADDLEESVVVVQFNDPFTSFVILPTNFVYGKPITVTGYIEDMFVQKLNKREIFKNVTILLDAELS